MKTIKSKIPDSLYQQIKSCGTREHLDRPADQHRFGGSGVRLAHEDYLADLAARGS
jgi:hypothetical protein